MTMIYPLFADRAPDVSPAHLAAVLPRITAMIGDGAYTDADALLRTALAGWDPGTAAPHPFLIAAAHAYVRLLPVSDALSAKRWARYARNAARELFGRADQRTADAITSLCLALSPTPHAERAAHRELAQAHLELLEICVRVYGQQAQETHRAYTSHAHASRAYAAACARDLTGAGRPTP